MNILYENEVNKEISVLDQAWNKAETFVFLPEKSGLKQKWLEQALEHFPENFQENHFALLTSGSTGRPKIIVGERKRSEELTKILHQVQDSETVRQTIVALPLTYCYAFVNQWLWARKFNRQLVITRGFSDAAQLKKALKNADRTMLCMVGAQVPFYRQNFAEEVFPGIIRLHFAGGRFPQEKLDFLGKMFPNAEIYNNYGCAEAMPRLTLRKTSQGNQAEDIGKPLPGIQLKIGPDNELLFSSPYGAVAEVNSEGFFSIKEWAATGDLARQQENGHWCLLGRANEVFKRYGEKIALPRLMSAVNHNWQGQAAFYREMDSRGEDGHVLILSPAPSSEKLKELLLQFRKNYPRAYWPLRIESASNLPLLSNGKIDKTALSRMNTTIVHWSQRI